MPLETWALIVSFIAMALIISSYFLGSKSGFLLFQSLGILFLMGAYLLDKQYFATIGLGIGLLRALVFFVYAKRDKNASVGWAFLFSVLTISTYFIVNIGILHTAKIEDVVYLVALVLYAFIFRIRDIERMRYMVTIPTALAILYNVLCGATSFVVISYVFELVASLIAILNYHVFVEKQSVNQGERI